MNIILEGHGTARGEYHIGSREIHPYAFRNILSGSKDGVQINAISGACYSGQFVDAIKTFNPKGQVLRCGLPKRRNGTVYYPQPQQSNQEQSIFPCFVQSLIKVSLPGVTRRRITERIQDHEAFMVDQLAKKLITW